MAKTSTLTLALALAAFTAFARTPQQVVDSSCLVDTHRGAGSGTLVTARGRVFVITAGHVAATATETGIKVKTLRDTYKATVVICDTNADVAILEIKPETPVSTSPVALDADPEVGTPIWSVGCFFGSSAPFSFSSGVVSFRNRILRSRMLDQNTAQAWPGSSGGGVFNVRGDLIGITLAIGATPAGQYMAGVGFYKPIRSIRKWAKEHKVLWIFQGS